MNVANLATGSIELAAEPNVAAAKPVAVAGAAASGPYVAQPAESNLPTDGAPLTDPAHALLALAPAMLDAMPIGTGEPVCQGDGEDGDTLPLETATDDATVPLLASWLVPGVTVPQPALPQRQAGGSAARAPLNETLQGAAALSDDGAAKAALAQRTRFGTAPFARDNTALGAPPQANTLPDLRSPEARFDAAMPLKLDAQAIVAMATGRNSRSEPAAADAALPTATPTAVDGGAAARELPALAEAPDVQAGASAGRRLTAVLGERIHYQSSQGIDVATVRLDPPMMGTVEIRIHHDASGMQVTIQASNAEVGRQLAVMAEALRQDLQTRHQTQATVTVNQRDAAFGQPGARGQHQPEDEQRVGLALQLEEAAQ